MSITGESTFVLGTPKEEDLRFISFVHGWEKVPKKDIKVMLLANILVTKKQFEDVGVKTSKNRASVFIDRDNETEMKIRFSLWSMISYEVLIKKTTPTTAVITGTHLPDDVYFCGDEHSEGVHYLKFKSLNTPFFIEVSME